MPDYDFYQNVYMGAGIPQRAFSGVIARAADTLASYKRAFRVVSSGQEAEKLALCAMAERLFEKESHTLTSQKAGNISLSYRKPDTSLEGQLYRAAALYLDFYRGVSQ